MKKKKLKSLPKFANESDERKFWAAHSSIDYFDWSKAKRVVFPNLKPSSKTISLRLPESIVDKYKVQANKRDVPYQSLMKIVLSDAINKL